MSGLRIFPDSMDSKVYKAVHRVDRGIHLAYYIGRNLPYRIYALIMLCAKEGMRKMLDLLRRLDKYAKKLEKEFKDISK